MPRTTQRWIIAFLVLLAGVALAEFIDLAFRRPALVTAVVLLAFAAAGEPKPFSWACSALDRIYGSDLARILADWVPLAILGGIVYAVVLAATGHSWRALAAAAMIYAADRVVGWTIDQHRMYLDHRQLVREVIAAAAGDGA